MKDNKKIRWGTVFLLGFIFMAIYCKRTEKEIGPVTYDLYDPDKQTSVILKIEDSINFISDFRQYVSLTAGYNDKGMSSVILSRLFDSFIDEKILLHEAKNRNISLSDNEIKQYLTNISRQFIEKDEKTGEKIDSKILFEKLLINKFTSGLIKDIKVIPKEIDDYYEKNKREFLKPDLIKLSQILLDSEEEAVATLKKLKDATEEFFRETARLVSMGVEAEKGGEMGIFKLGQLPFEMEKIVFALEKSEISQVLESSYGYHIFRLDEKYSAELVSKEDAAPEIEVKILNLKIKDFLDQYLKKLKSEMEWSFYPTNLPFPYQRENHE